MPDTATDAARKREAAKVKRRMIAASRRFDEIYAERFTRYRGGNDAWRRRLKAQNAKFLSAADELEALSTWRRSEDPRFEDMMRALVRDGGREMEARHV